MRVFVGIHASPALQEEVAEWRAYHSSLPVRWIASEDLHITLVPPWEEHDPGWAVEHLEGLQGFVALRLHFALISLGPTEHDYPTLFWARADHSEDIKQLAYGLREEFGYRGVRRFIPHITLARFDPSAIVRFPQNLFPEIISWPEEIDNVCLFEALPGPHYHVLAHLPLQK